LILHADLRRPPAKKLDHARCVIVPVTVMRELGGETKVSVLAEYLGEKFLTTVMAGGTRPAAD